MGQLCSCHRADRAWSSGKAVSQDALLSLPRRNGLGPRASHPNGRGRHFSGPYYDTATPSESLMTSPQYNGRVNTLEVSNPAQRQAAGMGEYGGYSLPRTHSPRGYPAARGGYQRGGGRGVEYRDQYPSPPTSHHHAIGSRSTMGESGFSSKGSLNLDTSSAGHPSSAPSTPELSIRRKPPPKPPRMRTDTSGHQQRHQGSGGEDHLSRGSLTPTPSLRSNGIHSLKSSIADVTQALDATLSRSFDGDDLLTSSSSPPNNGGLASPTVSGPSSTEEKVYNILTQTKQFMCFELEPLSILDYLRDEGVITPHTEVEIRRMRSKQSMCDYLVDIVTRRGHDAFIVFCDALRLVGNQGYLADFLEVLDTLVEIATANTMRRVEFADKSPDMRHRAFSFEGAKADGACGCRNNNQGGGGGGGEAGGEDDMFGEDSSFDITVSYVHRDTGQLRSIKEVASMKRRRRPLSITSEDLNTLLEESEKYVPVISVSLYSQCLNMGGLDTLTTILQNYPCIRELSMSKNHIGGSGMAKLGAALGGNRGLVALDLRLNTLGDDGAASLAVGVARHRGLRSLNVSSTSLTARGSSSLLAALAKNQSLTDLDMSFNELDDGSCKVLADAMVMNCPLRKLKLRSCGVREYGARCVFRALRRNARLTHLDMSGNRVMDESLTVLADILIHNRTLREINLENCHVSRDGCASLARALKTNTSLKRLELSMNPLIGDDGAAALSEGLRYNKAVDMLCLNMCNIANSGFVRILEALPYNTTMRTLKLCYNNIGQPAPAVMAPTPDRLGVPSSAGGWVGESPPPSPRDQFYKGGPATSLGGHFTFPGQADEEPSVEELYDKLCQVLQLNKDLKVLLWGNRFDEAGTAGVSAGSCSPNGGVDGSSRSVSPGSSYDAAPHEPYRGAPVLAPPPRGRESGV